MPRDTTETDTDTDTDSSGDDKTIDSTANESSNRIRDRNDPPTRQFKPDEKVDKEAKPRADSTRGAR